MRIFSSIFAAAVFTALFAYQSPADARPRVYLDFGLYGPGFGVYVGPGPRYYRYRRFYGPYPRYWRYRRDYYAPPPPSACGYWHRRCVENWGRRNNNYYGCMRYHGCD